MSVMPLIAVQTLGIIYGLRSKKILKQMELHDFEELEALTHQSPDDETEENNNGN
jgi:hypothetical protein